MQEVYRIRGEQVSSSGGFDVVVLQQQDRRGAVGAAQISKAAFLGSASRLVHNLTRTAGIYICMPSGYRTCRSCTRNKQVWETGIRSRA